MSHWQNDITHYELWHEIEATPFFSKPFIIPCAALVIGSLLFASKGFKAKIGPFRFNGDKVYVIGALVIYFGAQSFMNVYMSWLMRKSVVAKAGTEVECRDGVKRILTEDLTGIPAAFALTALQQVISFIVFIVYFVVAYFTPFRYMPKPLTTNFDRFCVVLFGLVFCMNIALNNFSLSLISIAVNLIIRSCLPLTTFLSQQVLATCDLYPKKPWRILEISLMCIGVTCAGIFTWAKMQSKMQETAATGGQEEEARGAMIYILGVLVCLASLLCGSLNLALAGVLGTSVHLNPMDTVAYMAIPATIFLTPVIFFLEKPVPGEWVHVVQGGKDATDWQIMLGAWNLCKRTGSMTFMYGILSGVFAFLYNVCQFTIVQTLSPSATAFGGNFNKAALIFLSLLTGLEQQVSYPWNAVIWCAILGNIAAFTLYSHLQMKAKVEHVELEEESSDSGEDSSDEYA
mmetsp:Transcript_5834/g.12277  ORF Transcript_5834/g.12277 Transcript_5834/m.12277 type:complete len:459 (-) Transcript_5834:165-1541(-)